MSAFSLTPGVDVILLRRGGWEGADEASEAAGDDQAPWEEIRKYQDFRCVRFQRLKKITKIGTQANHV